VNGVQKSTSHTTILTLFLVSFCFLASGKIYASPNFATKGQLNFQIAKEKAARRAADNALSASLRAQLNSQIATERAARTATDDAILANIRSSQHFIGEAYGGGLVFYVYDDGQHGLIAATSDLSLGISWSNGTSRVTATTGDGLNAGEMNTAIIVATQINDNPSSNFAAKLCADYSVTDVDGVTYGDWYLPSKAELNLLFLQKVASSVSGLTNNFYWSSTENALGTAWGLNLGNGSLGAIVKNSSLPVRAIRSF
jgi:hypothetical protein